jgi:hypothetical protein
MNPVGMRPGPCIGGSLAGHHVQQQQARGGTPGAGRLRYAVEPRSEGAPPRLGIDFVGHSAPAKPSANETVSSYRDTSNYMWLGFEVPLGGCGKNGRNFKSATPQQSDVAIAATLRK